MAELENLTPDKVLTDQIIRLNSGHGLTSYPDTLRRVHYRDPTGKEYVFLANRFDLSALNIADLYRQRWQIELFFRMDQTKPENQNFLWHFPKCRLNPKLDRLDSLVTAYLVENQKHGRFGHLGIDQAYSNHVDGTTFPLVNHLPPNTPTIIWFKPNTII